MIEESQFIKRAKEMRDELLAMSSDENFNSFILIAADNRGSLIQTVNGDIKMVEAMILHFMTTKDLIKPIENVMGALITIASESFEDTPNILEA